MQANAADESRPQVFHVNDMLTQSGRAAHNRAGIKEGGMIIKQVSHQSRLMKRQPWSVLQWCSGKSFWYIHLFPHNTEGDFSQKHTYYTLFLRSHGRYYCSYSAVCSSHSMSLWSVLLPGRAEAANLRLHVSPWPTSKKFNVEKYAHYSGCAVCGSVRASWCGLVGARGRVQKEKSVHKAYIRA